MDNFNSSRRDFLKLALGIGAVATLQAKPAQASLSRIFKNIDDADLYPIYDVSKYSKKNFLHLLKDSENLGLSRANLENHLGLYSGYVDKVNQAEAEMRAGKITDFGMKHLAFSLNGMVLHDIYFSNMVSDTSKRSGRLTKAIEASYGGFDAYFKNLIDIANNVEGWALTCVNLLNGQIINYGIADHSANYPAFVVPILAVDVYAHAYELDFTKTPEGKSKYLGIFKETINWDLVSERYDAVS